jgi:hypothetical protein
MVSTHAVVLLEMSDDRLDGGTPAHLALDLFCHAAFLASGVNLEAMGLRSVVALVSGASNDARQRCTNPLLNGRYDGFQCVAVIGGARQRLDMGDELAPPLDRMSVVAIVTFTPNS